MVGKEQAVAQAGAAGAVLGSMTHALPTMAAIFGVVWYGVCIWESKTGQFWRAKLKRENDLAIILGSVGACIGMALVLFAFLTGGFK